MMRKEYWAMYWYGTVETICSKHKTLSAARRAAKICFCEQRAMSELDAVKGVDNA
jgi:hypothetical protein